MRCYNEHNIEQYAVGGSEDVGYNGDESALLDSQRLPPIAHFVSQRPSSESDQSLDDAFYAEVGDENYNSDDTGGEPVQIGISDETYDSEPEDEQKSLATPGTSQEHGPTSSQFPDHLRNPPRAFVFSELPTSPARAVHGTYSLTKHSPVSILDRPHTALDNFHNSAFKNRSGSRLTSDKKQRPEASALCQNFKSFLEHQRKGSVAVTTRRYAHSPTLHNFPSAGNNYDSHSNSVENHITTVAHANYDTFTFNPEQPSSRREISPNMEHHNGRSALREYLKQQKDKHNLRVDRAIATAHANHTLTSVAKEEPLLQAVSHNMEPRNGTSALQEYLKEQKGKHNPRVDRAIATLPKPRVKYNQQPVKNPKSLENFTRSQIRGSLLTLDRMMVARLNDPYRQRFAQPRPSNDRPRDMAGPSRALTTTQDRYMAFRFNEHQRQRSVQANRNNVSSQVIGGRSTTLMNGPATVMSTTNNVSSRGMSRPSTTSAAKPATARSTRTTATPRLNALETLARRPATSMSKAPEEAEKKGKGIFKKLKAFFKEKAEKKEGQPCV
jgi:hypothetical protein